METGMNKIVEIVDAVEPARAALKIAIQNYARASGKHEKIMSTIETAEARLATRQNDLADYANADADAGAAAAQLLLKGAALELPEAVSENLAKRDALKAEIHILKGGLTSLHESLKTAYQVKREKFEALDAAASEVIKATSAPLAMELAALRERERVLVKKLGEYRDASIIRLQSDFYVSHHDFVGQLGTQLIQASEGLLPVDRWNAVEHTASIAKWHGKLLKDATAENVDGR
jgi:hypothetical protein